VALRVLMRILSKSGEVRSMLNVPSAERLSNARRQSSVLA
jgi:hypothetical protein